MRVTTLGSGSTGNAILIATERTKVLIDAGLSARETTRRMALMGVRPEELDAIIITHEHSDHIAGLRNLLKKVHCPVYITGPTEEAYYSYRSGNPAEGTLRRDSVATRREEIVAERDIKVGDIDIETFTVPHDAVDNFGFVAKSAGIRIALLTDFGHVTDTIREKLTGCDGIVIESNHSIDMLRACPVYSWSLKRRIAGMHGHLSNEDLGAWLQNDFDGSARHIILAHLSQKANDPHLARITAETALQMRLPLFRTNDTTIHITNHRDPIDWVEF